MSNRNKKMKKNHMLTGKKAGFLAVAAMSAVLVGGQVSAGAASAGAALLDCGSYAGAREKGLVRMEGKEYVVQDGDVILFRFNV